jgi:acetyl-CoA carboxylase biotin carboxyl carrier protein
VTDDLDRPTDGGADTNDATESADAPEAVASTADFFTPADLVAAGEALGPVQAIEEGTADPAPVTGPAEPPPAIAALPSEAQVPDDSSRARNIEPGDASLLALIDRLGAILERSDLVELEVESGRTTVVLRKPAALAPPPVTVGSSPVAEAPPAAATAAPAAEQGRGGTSSGSGGAPARPSVKAPLTGIWYASPTPGSAPFVEAGRELAVGQVVGLIEAMKLFNEIKSDIAGRVVRVVPDSGTLVKAKQPLIEVEPL